MAKYILTICILLYVRDHRGSYRLHNSKTQQELDWLMSLIIFTCS